jgi:hypothetical protein
MTNLKFVGPIELYYSTLGVTAKPGDVVDLDEAPDANWEPEKVGEPSSQPSADEPSTPTNQEK